MQVFYIPQADAYPAVMLLLPAFPGQPGMIAHGWPVIRGIVPPSRHQAIKSVNARGPDGFIDHAGVQMEERRTAAETVIGSDRRRHYLR